MRRRVPGCCLSIGGWTRLRTQPTAAALISGEFLVVSGEGRAYAEVEADAWLKQTGWRKLDLRSLAGAGGVIVAEAA